MNPFEELMKELGNRLDISIRLTSLQSCTLDFGDRLFVTIELDGRGDRLLIGSELGNINPGPYRDRIAREALQSNGAAMGPRGILSFSEKNDSLVLFEFLPLASIDGEKLINFLQTFTGNARVWVEALSRGDIPAIETVISPKESGFFGLKP